MGESRFEWQVSRLLAPFAVTEELFAAIRNSSTFRHSQIGTMILLCSRLADTIGGVTIRPKYRASLALRPILASS